MTLSPERLFAHYKDVPMFSLWAVRRDNLFNDKFYISDEGQKFDLVSEVYILMKRLSQDYEVIMRMPMSERRCYFILEHKLIEEERKENEKHKNSK